MGGVASNLFKNPLTALNPIGAITTLPGLAAVGIKPAIPQLPNAPELFPGAEKVKGFEVTPEAKAAEKALIERQMQIASGAAPSVSAMQYAAALDQATKQQQAAAASARGVNPALAFRAASQATAEAQAQAAQQAAIMEEQERRQADELLARVAAAQRGAALEQAKSNQTAQQDYRQGNLDTVSGLGQAMLGAGRK